MCTGFHGWNNSRKNICEILPFEACKYVSKGISKIGGFPYIAWRSLTLQIFDKNLKEWRKHFFPYLYVCFF